MAEETPGPDMQPPPATNASPPASRPVGPAAAAAAIGKNSAMAVWALTFCVVASLGWFYARIYFNVLGCVAWLAVAVLGGLIASILPLASGYGRLADITIGIGGAILGAMLVPSLLHGAPGNAHSAVSTLIVGVLFVGPLSGSIIAVSAVSLVRSALTRHKAKRP